MKIAVFQRVLPDYRYELLRELSEHIRLEVFATKGMKTGAQKTTSKRSDGNFKTTIVASLNFIYRGKRRDTFVPFYPQIFLKVKNYDVIVLEGTTNILNNIFLIPIAKFYKKKIVWWDAGFSEDYRYFNRRIKDVILSQMVRLTNAQMAYSTKAAEYIKLHMHGRNVFVNINTVATSWFELNKARIETSLSIKQGSKRTKLRLLYVGAIEKRKGLKKLVELLEEMKVLYNLTIIGNGSYVTTLSSSLQKLPHVIILPAIYDREILFPYYCESDLFVLPGEGGLAIVQSMQYGLPVITMKADGTENDYISSKEDGFIADSLDQFVAILRDISINKYYLDYLSCYKVYQNAQRFSSARWCENFCSIVSNVKASNKKK